jgi:hypothetical protein
MVGSRRPRGLGDFGLTLARVVGRKRPAHDLGSAIPSRQLPMLMWPVTSSAVSIRRTMDINELDADGLELGSFCQNIRGRREGCRGISSPYASWSSALQQCLGELHCRQNAGLTAWPAAYRSSALDCCAGSYGAAHHPNRESSRINPSPQRKDVRE